MHVALRVLTLAVTLDAVAHAQLPLSNSNAQRALIAYRLGWEALRSEAWVDGAKEFQRAIDLDKKFKLAYYGLGRADMALKKFADAARAYEECRSLYEAQAGENFLNRQDAERIRQNDLLQLQTAVSTLSSRSGNQSQDARIQSQLQQLRQQMQRTQLKRDEDRSYSISSPAPAFVRLALGSAYFRQERFDAAEREYKATIEADPKAGEAHNNLAVVYILTRRFDAAEQEVKLAEQSGFRVNQGLKDDLAAARRKGR